MRCSVYTLFFVVQKNKVESTRSKLEQYGSTLSDLVLVAGLEPARYLYRGILRYLRVDFQENFTKEEKCKNGAVLHEKPSKMPQNKQFLQKIIHAPISLKNSQVPRSSQILNKETKRNSPFFDRCKR